MRSFHPLAAAAACLLFAATSLPARGQEREAKPSVSTSGDATIYVKPDEVVLMFGVETFDPALEKAKQQNDAASAKLTKAVRDVGVPERQLQVAELQVELRYHDSSDRDRHPVGEIAGYYARRSYSAVLKDVRLLDKLIAAVLANGANQFDGVDFRTTELRKHRDAARRMAIRAAKEKATLLAGELGVAVGAPRTITEGGSYGGYFGGYFGGRYGRFGGASQNQSQNVAQEAPAPADGAGDADQTMPLGQIAVRASVSVTFDLK